MSGSSIEKVFPRAGLVRLARKANVSLDVSTGAVEAMREHLNDSLGASVRRAIEVAQINKRKTVLPRDLGLDAPEVKMNACQKVKLTVKRGNVSVKELQNNLILAQQANNPAEIQAARDALLKAKVDLEEKHLKKIEREVQQYSAQTDYLFLPKRSFNVLVKTEFEKHCPDKKISPETIVALQIAVENHIMKTLNAAALVAVSYNKKSIKKEHVKAAVEVMSIARK